jgi:hypothetical protein
MPRKAKPRKPVASFEEVWIAPRPVKASKARTFSPTGASPSNRYLDFADIALGAKKLSSGRKKSGVQPHSVLHDRHDARHDHKHQPDQTSGSKVTPINRPRTSRPNQGFGAFRGPR